MAIDLRNRGRGGSGKQFPAHVKMWWYIRRELLGLVDEVDGEIRKARAKLGIPLIGSAAQTISFMGTMLYNVTTSPTDYPEMKGWLDRMGLDVNLPTDQQDIDKIKAACQALKGEMQVIIDSILTKK